MRMIVTMAMVGVMAVAGATWAQDEFFALYPLGSRRDNAGLPHICRRPGGLSCPPLAGNMTKI